MEHEHVPRWNDEKISKGSDKTRHTSRIDSTVRKDSGAKRADYIGLSVQCNQDGEQSPW